MAVDSTALDPETAEQALSFLGKSVPLSLAEKGNIGSIGTAPVGATGPPLPGGTGAQAAGGMGGAGGPGGPGGAGGGGGTGAGGRGGSTPDASMAKLLGLLKMADNPLVRKALGAWAPQSGVDVENLAAALRTPEAMQALFQGVEGPAGVEQALSRDWMSLFSGEESPDLWFQSGDLLTQIPGGGTIEGATEAGVQGVQGTTDLVGSAAGGLAGAGINAGLMAILRAAGVRMDTGSSAALGAGLAPLLATAGPAVAEALGLASSVAPLLTTASAGASATGIGIALAAALAMAEQYLPEPSQYAMSRGTAAFTAREGMPQLGEDIAMAPNLAELRRVIDAFNTSHGGHSGGWTFMPDQGFVDYAQQSGKYPWMASDTYHVPFLGLSGGYELANEQTKAFGEQMQGMYLLKQYAWEHPEDENVNAIAQMLGAQGLQARQTRKLGKATGPEGMAGLYAQDQGAAPLTNLGVRADTLAPQLIEGGVPAAEAWSLAIGLENQANQAFAEMNRAAGA